VAGPHRVRPECAWPLEPRIPWPHCARALGAERCRTPARWLKRPRESVAIARIDALTRFRPAVGLAFIAGGLVIGVAVVLGPFACAFMWIIGDVVAAGRLSGVILGYGKRKREQRSQEQHSHGLSSSTSWAQLHGSSASLGG
jgi:hypothetical protein